MVKFLFLVFAFCLGSCSLSGQTVTGVSLPAPAEEFLLDLARDAGLAGVRVTSFERTARRQAELMYELLESVGVDPVRDQYDSIGDRVVDYYELNRNLMSGEELIAGMEQVVSAGVRAAPNRQQMMHVLPTNNYTFDVAPSSVVPNEDQFIQAIMNHAGSDLANYILPGPAERAFHLEVRRTLPTVSGQYAGVCAFPENGTETMIAITLTREAGGYSGRSTESAQSSPVNVIELDRVTKSVVLQTEIGGDTVELAGTLQPGYAAMDLLTPAPCLLERMAE